MSKVDYSLVYKAIANKLKHANSVPELTDAWSWSLYMLEWARLSGCGHYDEIEPSICDYFRHRMEEVAKGA